MDQLETASVVADDSVSAAVEDQTTTTQADDQPEAREPEIEALYPDDEGKVSKPEDDADDAGDGDPDPDPEVNDDEPEIKAPNSLNAAEKEAFSKLPREAQEMVARRVTQADTFAQQKAAEAQNARASVEREALGTIQQLQATYAQVVNQYAAQFDVPPPHPRLIAEDPDTYAYQLEAHQQSLAQRQQAQQQAGLLQRQAEETQRQIAAIEAQQTEAVLKDKFPEYLDPNEGPKLRQELGSIAIELGYPEEALNQVDATDILAMKAAHEWKAKAAKWDALQKDKMAGVRAAKSLPRMAKPGAATGARDASSVPIERRLYPND